MANRDEARVVGYSWHGGKSSGLYAFASTGRIHSESHRSEVLYELNRTWENTGGRITAHDVTWFERTVRYCETVPLEKENRPEFHRTIPDWVWEKVSGEG